LCPEAGRVRPTPLFAYPNSKQYCANAQQRSKFLSSVSSGKQHGAGRKISYCYINEFSCQHRKKVGYRIMEQLRYERLTPFDKRTDLGFALVACYQWKRETKKMMKMNEKKRRFINTA